MKIQVLDPSVANKIAAGEVVERPASIVKELTENCIDAGATGVTVEIRGGGIESIRVTDNGCGMERDDVKNAFLRHATSKIRTAEDLGDILTLGFRGEALASIASVAKVRVNTRGKEEAEGTELKLTGGVIDDFTSCGCPEGTTLWVDDLFFNTPARRKFLKRPGQEANYISDVCVKMALSHPNVSFRLISEGKTVLRTPGDGNLLSAIRAIYGADVAKHMLPVDYTRAGITLTGFIGDREIQKSNRSWQILFINGRSVKNDQVSVAVQQAYTGRLNVGKFPFFVLEMRLPGTLVDVNVHPTKQEVRFADGLPVFGVVQEAVSRVLREHQEIPTLFDTPEEPTLFENRTAVGVTFEKPTGSVPEKAAPAENITEKPDIPAAEPAKKPGNGRPDPVKHIPAEAYRPLSEDFGGTRLFEKTAFSARPSDGAADVSYTSPAPQSASSEEIKKFNEFVKASTGNGVRDGGLKPWELIKTPTVTEVDAIPGKNAVPETDDGDDELLNRLKEKTQTAPGAKEQPEPAQTAPQKTPEPAQAPREAEQTAMDLPEDRSYRVLGVLFDTYIVLEAGDDAYLIDQHAAHERLLFEKFYAAEGSNVSQLMLLPQVLRVSPSEQTFLEDLLPELTAIGFEIESMGYGSFGVKATPSILEGADAEKFITSLLDESASFRQIRGNEPKRARLIQLACKSAIKAGDKLSESDIRKLMQLILAEGIPLSCPHGRPILVRLSKRELEVRFKRIQ